MAPSLAALIQHYDRPGPRYTGYPMPPAWKDDFPESALLEALEQTQARQTPLSLYVHIPFCKRRCAYCACSALPSSRRTPVKGYLDTLEAEADLWLARLGAGRQLLQLHWGGGTPNFLEGPELQRLFHILASRFTLAPGAELAVEVDPTHLEPDQLPILRELGFNRVSFGVQDLNEDVQRLIGRHQTWTQTQTALEQARDLGFSSINLDLVYGLPGQSRQTFQRTLDGVLALKPDRLAIYGFAYLPALMAHQGKIPADKLPSPELRLELLTMASMRLEAEGYLAVGMDHFARPEDPLARAVEEGRLTRNFMGYAIAAGQDLLGLGPTAISDVGGVYSQNEKSFVRWQRSVASGHFPTYRGLKLTEEDRLRRWVIHQLMGAFELRWDEMATRFGIEGPSHFARALDALAPEEALGTLRITPEGLFVTPLGRRFVRSLVQPFDAYLPSLASRASFSRTV